MIIKEAEKHFNPDEDALHKVLATYDEALLMSYILKRNFYKEPTQKELESINDIYATGFTYFDIDLYGKVNKLRLLNSDDYLSIKEYIDKEFETNLKIKGDEERRTAKQELNTVAVVAAAVETMHDSNIEADASMYLGLTDNNVLAAKIMYLKKLPSALIKTLYDRYMEFENRIYDIFQYESVKKK